MEKIRLTSWYGKYPIIYRVSYIPGGCFGFLNHQQYQVKGPNHFLSVHLEPDGHPFKMVVSICWMFPNLPLWDGCLTKHPHKSGCLVFQAHTQCGRLSVIRGVITPTVYKWPYKWATGIITPISGVIILLMNGRGPHCTISSGLKNTGKQWKTLAFPKLMYVYVYIIIYANIYHKI